MTHILRELTHRLFDCRMDIEAYKRATAPTHPHPHGRLPEAPKHIAEMVEAIRAGKPSHILFRTLEAEKKWLDMVDQVEAKAMAKRLFPNGIEWSPGATKGGIDR